MNFGIRKIRSLVLACALISVAATNCGCNIEQTAQYGVWAQAQGKADLANKSGKLDEAESGYEQALALAKGLPELLQDAASFQGYAELGLLYLKKGMKADAELSLEKARKVSSKLWRERDDAIPFDSLNGSRLAKVLVALAKLRAEQGHYQTAEALYHRASVLQRRFVPASSPEVAETREQMIKLQESMERTRKTVPEKEPVASVANFKKPDAGRK